VIFFEPKRRYHEKAELDETVPPVLKLHQAKVVREGADATLFCYGPMVKTCLQAAEVAAEDGRNLEVVDLRTISPFDLETIFASVKKTRRAVVVHEATLSFGPGSEIAARVTEECFYHLEAPVLRVTGYDTPYPPSRMEEEYLPDLDRVLDGIDRVMGY
jgi:2-oxoisovalerate dehydrogenase E1 component beta subunit